MQHILYQPTWWFLQYELQQLSTYCKKNKKKKKTKTHYNQASQPLNITILSIVQTMTSRPIQHATITGVLRYQMLAWSPSSSSRKIGRLARNFQVILLEVDESYDVRDTNWTQWDPLIKAFNKLKSVNGLKSYTRFQHVMPILLLIILAGELMWTPHMPIIPTH